ncbi:MAG: hypothetical protein MK052_01765 [Alphaproteobacteria bacterium]|nr:hypothetical protein [Alphaproteobacteria bacterium]
MSGNTDTQIAPETGRNQSVEAMSRAARDAAANAMRGMFRDHNMKNVGIGAGMVGHDQHLAGTKNTKLNTMRDEARNDAVGVHAEGSAAARLAEIEASKSIDPKYVNPTMHDDAFAKQPDKQPELSGNAQNSSRGQERAANEEADKAPRPRDITEATARSANEGYLGKLGRQDKESLSKPKEQATNKDIGFKPSASLREAASQVRVDVAALRNAGVAMGGKDGGRSTPAATVPAQGRQQSAISI